MEEKTASFHLEEYKQLRSEVVGLVAKTDLYLRYSVLVPAGVYAWILTSATGTHSAPSSNGVIATSTCLKIPPELLWMAWLVPPTFVLFCAAISLALGIRISQFGDYLRRIESALGHSQLGWEHFNVPLTTRLTWTHAAVWLALLLACGLATTAGLCFASQNKVLCASALMPGRR